MSKWIPHVGQRVQLNKVGYATLHLTSNEAHEQAKRMVITDVENLGHAHAPIWAIEVDQPLINIFLLDSSMVDPIF